eukprot:TRINITY_DN6947_c0_g1_i1.p1 TRINITY_DN6947_c0_g1~~TRINITY_DN6947_c0_g1_i1.p1  ORF type:complete len:393 (+),score=102.82 TRINITY_DN6947_c0_g1_i1:119-1297(+)
MDVNQAEKAAFDPTESKAVTEGEAPVRVQEAAIKEAAKPVQTIDSNTKPDEVPETAPGKPIAMILSPEERPVDTVFQNIVNFRDVGGNYNNDTQTQTFKPLNFFRSGRLDDACTADIDLLKNKYNIQCVIDLRTETEGKMGEDLVNTFPASAIAEQLKPFELLNPSTGSTPTKPTVKDETKDQNTPTRVTYFINFAGRRFRYYAVWKPLSLSQKMKTLYLMATHRKALAIKYIGESVVKPIGLIGLNYNFVDDCGGEIVQALKIMAKPQNYPILVHCTQGKDRTGLVVALALSICGASEEMIVKDYGRTQQGLARQRDVMVEEMKKTGLDPSFSDAPPQIMTLTLDYIKSTHGSCIDYVRRHGLTEDHIQGIRANLLLPAANVATPEPAVSQ